MQPYQETKDATEAKQPFLKGYRKARRTNAEKVTIETRLISSKKLTKNGP